MSKTPSLFDGEKQINKVTLEQLRYVDAKKAEVFIDSINRYLKSPKAKGVIVGLGTGGTFSCETKVGSNGDETSVPQEISFAEWVRSEISPSIAKDNKFFDLSAFVIDSSDITKDHIRDLVTVAAYIIQNVEKSIDGMIVIHGTDRMSESATKFAFQMGETPYPIIFTGSQKAASEGAHADAQRNVEHAIRSIRLKKIDKKAGISVVFGGNEYNAVTVEKRSATRMEGIVSRRQKPWATYATGIREKLVDWVPLAIDKDSFSPTLIGGDVPVIKMLPEITTETDVLDLIGMIRSDVMGVIYPRYGSGTVNEDIFRAVHDFCEENKKLLFVTNLVDPYAESNYEATNLVNQLAEDARTCVVDIQNMTHYAAMAKAQILWKYFPNDLSRIKQEIGINMLGEIGTKNQLVPEAEALQDRRIA